MTESPSSNELGTRKYNGRDYYVINNPFYISDLNRHQKYRRYCIVCGNERFDEERIKKQDFWAIYEMINVCRSCGNNGNEKMVDDIPENIRNHLCVVNHEMSDKQWKHMKVCPHTDNNLSSPQGYTLCADCPSITY